MQSIGETLRQARHAKKATLEDISRVTKVKIDILEKLEADDFASLSGPMYTKGFIKIYADFLGLDSAALVDAYLKSQGGLRRQGLHVETEVQIRARKQRELHLPLAGVVRVVAAVTVAVLLVLGIHHLWTHRHSATPAKVTALPVVDVDAYYQPKQKPTPQLLEPPKP